MDHLELLSQWAIAQVQAFTNLKRFHRVFSTAFLKMINTSPHPLTAVELWCWLSRGGLLPLSCHPPLSLSLSLSRSVPPSSLYLPPSLSLSFRPSIPSSLFLLPSHPLSVPPSSLYLPPSLSLSPLSLSLTHSVFLQISLLFSLLPSVSPTLFLPPLSLSLFSICFPLSHMQSSHTYTVILSTMDNSLSFPPLPCIFLHTVGTINITSSDIKMINALWLICLLPMESSHTLLRSNKVYFSTLEFDRSSGQISVSTDTGWPPGGRALPDDCREFPDVPNNKYDWNFNVQTLIICTIHINQLVSNCTLYWT